MSDALPLLPRLKVDKYEKLAERLRVACQSGDPDDVRKWATDWIRKVAEKRGLDLTTQQQTQMGWRGEWIGQGRAEAQNKSPASVFPKRRAILRRTRARVCRLVAVCKVP